MNIKGLPRGLSPTGVCLPLGLVIARAWQGGKGESDGNMAGLVVGAPVRPPCPTPPGSHRTRHSAATPYRLCPAAHLRPHRLPNPLHHRPHQPLHRQTQPRRPPATRPQSIVYQRASRSITVYRISSYSQTAPYGGSISRPTSSRGDSRAGALHAYDETPANCATVCHWSSQLQFDCQQVE